MSEQRRHERVGSRQATRNQNPEAAATDKPAAPRQARRVEDRERARDERGWRGMAARREARGARGPHRSRGLHLPSWTPRRKEGAASLPGHASTSGSQRKGR
ncbi:unnamed protein product [Lampetra planeri]